MALFSNRSRSKAKVATTQPAPKPLVVYAIKSAEQLLAAPRPQKHVKMIKGLLNLPSNSYNRLYLPVINQFAEFVQGLPENQKGIFAYSGGFLEHGLERAVRALALCLEYFFPGAKRFCGLSHQEALWLYAVFTAALLLDANQIPVKYQVTLCDAEGRPLQPWLPYAATMGQLASYYQFDYVQENRDELRQLITPLLARQLLDSRAGATSGFNWIASDPLVLEAWLALLTATDQRASITAFMAVVPLADMQTINSRLRNLKISHPATASIFNLVDSEELFITKEQPVGTLFLSWLRDRLSQGAMELNTPEAKVCMTEAGVLLSTELFSEFAAGHSQHKNPEVVARQFRHLIEHYQMSRNELGQRYSAIGGVARIAMEQWLLVHNPYLLFAFGQVPPAHSSLIQVLSLTRSNQPNPSVKPPA